MLNNTKPDSNRFQLGDHLIQIEFGKAPQFSELLFDRIRSKVHWITATCSLITVYYWWSKEQFNWSIRLILSFVCNLILHLLISCFYSLNLTQFKQNSIVNDLKKRDNLENLKLTNTDDFGELDNELLKESRTIKHKEWLNRFLNEIWPRICANCKMESLEQGIKLGRFITLNRFNLTKTQTPTIDKVNLVNQLDTPNGQIIILDLIAQIDWSTIDNENIISLSILNLQFTISNLHTISTKLRLRLCLHYLSKQRDKNLYKITFTLLDLPIIRNYETSGAAYLLYFFNLHLTFIYSLIEKFLIFPRTLVFVLDRKFFDLDTIENKFKASFLINLDLDLDDLRSLAMQHTNTDLLDDLIKTNNEQINDIIISKIALQTTEHNKTSTENQSKDEFKSKERNKSNEKNEFKEQNRSNEEIRFNEENRFKEGNRSNEENRSQGQNSSKQQNELKEKNRSKESNIDNNKESNKFTKFKMHKSIKVSELEQQPEFKKECGKLKQLYELFNHNINNKIAKYIFHFTMMYGQNVPIPKAMNQQTNLAYYVRIKFGDVQLITNAHSSQEPVIYWMQSFMLAVAKLNYPIYLAVLVHQINQTNQTTNTTNYSNKPEVKKITVDSSFLSLNTMQYEAKKIRNQFIEFDKQTRAQLKECFEIKLTDNLEQFLNSHNLNGRLYTIEDEHSKCRLTVRISIFNLVPSPNLRLQNVLNENVFDNTIVGLPVGVLSLFISHISNIEFISNLKKQNLEQYCLLSVKSFSQSYLFRSLNIGNEQHFKQNCFLILFNLNIERIKFKLYFAKNKHSKDTVNHSTTINTTTTTSYIKPLNLETSDQQFLTATLTDLNQAINFFQTDHPPIIDEKLSSNGNKLNENFKALAWCDLTISLDKMNAQYDKIKFNGALKDAYLHIYHCYSEIVNAKRLLSIMIDSEQTCLNYIQNASE